MRNNVDVLRAYMTATAGATLSRFVIQFLIPEGSEIASNVIAVWKIISDFT